MTAAFGETESPTGAARGPYPFLGSFCLAALLAYSAWVHTGLGFPPGGAATAWWHPTRFLLSWELNGGWDDAPLLGLLSLSAPAVLLAGLVFFGLRSALLRSLAVSCVAMIALFGFYALFAGFVWKFFHWRASLVMVVTGLALGVALCSPLLAAAWLRRGFWPGAAAYAFVSAAAVGVLRGATGTDEALAFSISPWPALSIFGLEVGAYCTAGAILGLAVAVLGFSVLKRSKGLGAALLAVGAALPFGWILLRFGSLPAAAGQTLVPAFLGAVAISGLTRGPGRPRLLLRRASHLALGAVLVIAPLFAGRALATGDYTVSRFVRAQRITDALNAYYGDREEYPDRLEQLVAGGYLDRVPRPRVGFELFARAGWTSLPSFSYQNLGSSYVLEFFSTEWVQCAYSPPWEDEEETAEEDEDFGGAWSCPDSRPELW